jgi:nitrite reductase (NO-forming)
MPRIAGLTERFADEFVTVAGRLARLAPGTVSTSLPAAARPGFLSGQTVNVTFVNNGNMTHSIDFHAAQTDPAVAYRSVNPREEVEFSFVARTPGAFVYHCGTYPVLQHIANGMYGAIIVDPAPALPAADVSYVLVQSEWYTQQVSGTQMSGDYQKMMNVTPDEVVFNGIAFQYNSHPLTAKVGQRVRL